MSGIFAEPTWAVLELFGHRRLGGRVQEIEQFGARMLRIDIPSATEPNKVYATQTYGGGAIYGCHPVTEEVARAAARLCQPEPATLYERQLGSGGSDDAPADDDQPDYNHHTIGPLRTPRPIPDVEHEEDEEL
jgi:hypothetical protein